MDKDKYYEIFKAKDRKFDGQFYVGVKSTRIYCRPICTARLPKKENCTFYKTQAEAEVNGYRPCLICRPELAPGLSNYDKSKYLPYKSIELINDLYEENDVLTKVANILNITNRHLRRIINSEFNVNPTQYLNTIRLLNAKALLTDTNLSIIDIAFASGFSSLRTFNRCFKEKYDLSPSYFKKNKTIKTNNDINIYIPYKTPYNFKELLDFFKERQIDGVEEIKDDIYRRTIKINKKMKFILVLYLFLMK